MRSGVSVAFFTILPVVLSFIGEIGGMNSDILKEFSIALLFKFRAKVASFFGMNYYGFNFTSYP